MIESRTFNTLPGATAIFNSDLYGVRVLGVEREGLGYTAAVVGAQTNREYSYFAGRIYFDPLIPFNAGEKVWVLFET